MTTTDIYPVPENNPNDIFLNVLIRLGADNHTIPKPIAISAFIEVYEGVFDEDEFDSVAFDFDDLRVEIHHQEDGYKINSSAKWLRFLNELPRVDRLVAIALSKKESTKVIEGPSEVSLTNAESITRALTEVEKKRPPVAGRANVRASHVSSFWKRLTPGCSKGLDMDESERVHFHTRLGTRIDIRDDRELAFECLTDLGGFGSSNWVSRKALKQN